MTTHRKRPANQKGGKGGPQRPTRSERTAAAASGAPRDEVAEVSAGLGLAIDLDGGPAAAPLKPGFDAIAAPVVAGYASAGPAPVAAPRGVLPSRTRGRSTPRVYALSREQEYAFIREDMYRLLIIAGILLVLMIALLFILER